MAEKEKLLAELDEIVRLVDKKKTRIVELTTEVKDLGAQFNEIQEKLSELKAG